MSTTPFQWPDDPMERIEAKLDHYRDEHRQALYGDPADPAKIGIDGRVRNMERDISTFKAAGAVVGTGAIAALADLLKRKFGIGQ